MSVPIEDFQGLRVLWPAAHDASSKYKHDIVLVHGLRRGPISDWGDDEGGIFWPLDLLAHDLENTRILSFGYHGKKSTYRTKDRIFSHGEALCNDLADERVIHKTNPFITFLGHGTGGIVIKSALSLCHAKRAQFGSILDQTKHVIFLDTPHHGLNAEAWRALSGGSLNDSEYENWGLWQTVLSDLRQVFTGIAGRFNITSACASLIESEAGIGGQPVPGDSGLTCLPSERVLHLHGVKHLTICKFSARDDNYTRLKNRILAGWSCLVRDESNFGEWIQKCAGEIDADSLNDSIHKRNLKYRCEGTCSWLPQNPQFKAWKDETRCDPVLWLTGPSGVGKSMLCSAAVDDISNKRPSSATPYLFLTYGKGRTRNHMYATLASQLWNHVILEEGGVEKATFAIRQEAGNTTEKLEKLIRFLVDQCSAVYFFIDGLNEIRQANKVHGADLESETLPAQLKSVLDFLFRLSRRHDSETPVKIWCGSQRLPPVIDWMKEMDAIELSVDESSVKKDVLKYLYTEIQQILNTQNPDITTDDIIDLVVPPTIRARCSFRWAYMLIKSLEDCNTSKELVERAQGYLPGELRDFYSKRLNDLRLQDNQDVRHGHQPLSKYILSIVAYAKRPLKVAELQEAVSIVRNPLQPDGCPDLFPATTVYQKDILHRCAPLIEFVPAGSSDGYLRVSHASVYEFLREPGSPRETSENTSSSHASITDMADRRFIAEACLKYLSQRRYSRLLQKEACDKFKTASEPPEYLASHYFLKYAAKYWYRHLEHAGPGDQRAEEVRNFLLSPQFLTAIQVQSLFVVGHFIHNFDSNTHSRRLMKRNMPEWFRHCEEGDSIARAYEEFVVEWGRLLQLGITKRLNGEIERCFFGALGPNNFLQRRRDIEANPSFQITDKESVSKEVLEQCCCYETLSPDGRRLSIWKVIWPQKDCLSFKRTVWHLDGSKDPQDYGTESFKVDASMVNWPLYDPCRSRSFPLIPSLDSPAREMPIESILNPSQVRIGSAEFLRKPGGMWEMSRPPLTGKPLPYWDHVVRQGPYIVRSRRRLIQHSEAKTLHNHSIHTTVMTSTTQRPGRAKGQRHPDSGGESETDSDCAEISENNTEDILSSAGEVWTAGFSSSSEASNTKDGQAESTSSDDEIMVEGPGFSDSDSCAPLDYLAMPMQLDSDIDMESIPKTPDLPESEDDNDEDDSARSLDTRPTNSDADDEKSNSSYDSDGSDFPDVPGQPMISSVISRPTRGCGRCWLSIIRHNEASATRKCWYTCVLCRPSRHSWGEELGVLDICARCLLNGHWCNDKNHQLKKMTYRGDRLIALEIVSVNTAKAGMNITVYREGEDDSDPVKVFQYTSRSSTMLYDSAPIIHPAAPLLVYAVDGQRFLFANLGTNTYLNHDIPLITSSGSSLYASRIAISVQMRFSPCGRFLHVIRFLAHSQDAYLRDHMRYTHQKQEQAPCTSTIAVSAPLWAVQLSTRNLCSGLPRTLQRHHNVALGDFATTVTTRLPFAVTWTDAAAFISVSGERLRVYRMPLACSPDGPKAGRTNDAVTANERRGLEEGDVVETPSREVVLPRSARARPVYFFPPARNNTNATLVLGARYSELMAAPVVVNVRPQSLGDWRPASEATVAVAMAEQLETRGDLEDFDVNSDCDLIIPLIDHQR